VNRTKLETVKESKYGHRAKVFVACDDGARICIMCLGEVNGPLDLYGVTRKHGRCYHCEFEVIEKA
jgi:hypothetical protein